jgi:hypothetical protein
MPAEPLLNTKTQTSAWNILRRVYGLLNRRERKTGWLLLAAVLLNSVVDLLGLAVVIPVIGLVINPELMETHEFLGKVYDVAFSWGIGSQTHFLIALCLFLIGAFRTLGQSRANAFWISCGPPPQWKFMDAPLFGFPRALAIQIFWAHPRRNQRVAHSVCPGIHHGWTIVFQRTRGHGALGHWLDRL